jgi:RNA polymerase sigma factor (TIGR02999 family)
MNPPPDDITELLLNWSKGDRTALDKLTPLVYAQLRRLADGYLRRERPDHTLQATALVHEAYLKLVDQTVVDWKSRAQFFGLSAQIMRNILVDHARSHKAEKRGSGERKVSLDEAIALPGGSHSELVALDDALKTLAAIDPDKSRLIELRYFGGLNAEEMTEVTGLSPATVRRHLRLAESWLHREIKEP